MYELVKIDSQFPIEKVLEFCKHSKKDSLPGSDNLDIDQWEEKPYTLLYLIYKEKRYDALKSSYIGLKYCDNLIAGAGYYPLEVDPNVVNLNSRYYTIPTFRNKVHQGNFILPKMLEEVSKIYKIGLFSYNTYNLWLKTALTRINNNKAAFFGKKIPEGYKGWIEIKDPLIIKNTEQYCFYKIFDISYEEQFLKNIKQLQNC